MKLQDNKMDQNRSDILNKAKCNEEVFRTLMHEAFENFKISTELEQTKRLRQIGDLLSNQ